MSARFSRRFFKSLMIAGASVAIGIGAAQYAQAESVVGPTNPSLKMAALPFANIGENRIIRTEIATKLSSGSVDGRTFRNPDAMQAAYAGRNGEPLWIGRSGAADHIADFITVLEESWTHGLNPEQYHLTQIKTLAGSDSPQDRAHLDLLISDAVMRYGQDVTGMRVAPDRIRQKAEYWRQPMAAGDVLMQVSASDDPADMLEDLAPQGSLYDRLRDELVTLSRSPERAAEEAGPVNFGGGLLRPGEYHKNVPKLRARMGQTHDPMYGPENLYDDELAAAVMKFQAQHGLSADGVLGPKTLAFMNQSVRDKMEQIIVNLERLRWLEQEKPHRYILVNIPSATLWAVEGNSVEAQMPVIVGRKDRPTKSFTTEITGIRFNPKWNVPTTIKTKDYLPRLKEDPYYLQDKGIEVYRVIEGRRETVDPASVDWANMTRSDLARLNMQQGAGDNNALGRIRVLMPNQYDIYLHDTNSPGLFANNDRTLSSGCVRMADPEKVARFILGPNPGWSDERMHGLIARGSTSEVKAEEKLPVYFLYQTVWLDNRGQLVYGPDIYSEDQRLLSVLKDMKAYAIPDRDGVKFAAISQNPIVQ
ncbi:L,D-transpeptidase family protein [Micavibrio aeruginosavorus]|uniref:L,D-TPase catalytic domain-containing protein n=1 Tax=Micavibrio aeruginosavorus EPB TaxID=349215 RepID=M4VGY9_9BACT|nr:L,D-transpeptidase family protein [Micavibrio aeruginosavorus]AGH97755.1 hypothetical protein A11S_934 [Micavibrio aeruginosavorus EPB]